MFDTKKPDAPTGRNRRPDPLTREGLAEMIEHFEECAQDHLDKCYNGIKWFLSNPTSLERRFYELYGSKTVGARTYSLHDVFVSVNNPSVGDVATQDYVLDFEAEIMQTLFNGNDKAAGSVLTFAQISPQFLNAAKQVAGEIIDGLEKGPTPQNILEEALRFRERFLQPAHRLSTV